jgi:hypothetical protein
LFPPDRTVAIRGKLALGFDRILTYGDVIARDPTPRMLEAAFASLADAINYTVEGILLVMGRAASQYPSAPAALAAAYPTIARAGRQVPPESRLREIITHVPPEADLRETISRRNTSVHLYPDVRYVPALEVQEAHHDAQAFWGASVAVLARVPGLEDTAAILEALLTPPDEG